MNMTGRLTRSRNDKMIAGVAGGIGRYLAVDPVIVRLIFVLLAFSGYGLLIYPVLWLVMPQENGTGANTGKTTRLNEDPNAVFVAGGPARQVRFDPMTGEPLEPEQEIPINNVNAGAGAAGGDDMQARRNRTLGFVLLGMGAIFLLKMALPGGLAPYIFPALLIGAGIFLLRRAR